MICINKETIQEIFDELFPLAINKSYRIEVMVDLY